MSTVIPFPKNIQHRERPAALGDDEKGRIVFFTGVRIERHSDDATPHVPDPQRSSGGRRRKA